MCAVNDPRCAREMCWKRRENDQACIDCNTNKKAISHIKKGIVQMYLLGTVVMNCRV